jgi:hypothetical protein
MAALFLLLALVAGIGIGDLMLENPTGSEVTVFHQPISGHSQGALLAAAAALGFAVALLLVASLGAARARRARRERLPGGARDAWTVPARGRHTVGHRAPDWLDELGPDRWSRLPDDPDATRTGDPAPYQPEPLYQQTWRAARLRDDPDHHLPPSNGRVR